MKLIAILMLGLLLGGQPLGAGELPGEVVAALAAEECEQLSALNRRYWRALKQGAGEQPAAVLEASIAALEAQILAQPSCGRTSGELIDVHHVEGADFFHPHAPRGLADQAW